ncbi:zinc finger domain-containing protein [Streptomyces corynorhini]
MEQHACPKCDAQPGSPCRSRGGAVTSAYHTRPLHPGTPAEEGAAGTDPRRPQAGQASSPTGPPGSCNQPPDQCGEGGCAAPDGPYALSARADAGCGTWPTFAGWPNRRFSGLLYSRRDGDASGEAPQHLPRLRRPDAEDVRRSRIATCAPVAAS